MISSSIVQKTTDRFIKIIETKGWKKYTRNEDKSEVKFGLRDENKSIILDCIFRVLRDRDCCILSVTLKDRIKPKHRLDVAEFTTRANYGLIVGRFQLDMNDGEVGYWAYVQINNRLFGEFETPPSKEVLEDIIDLSVSTFSKYVQGILQLNSSDNKRSPKELCDEIEGNLGKAVTEESVDVDTLLKMAEELPQEDLKRLVAELSLEEERADKAATCEQGQT